MPFGSTTRSAARSGARMPSGTWRGSSARVRARSWIRTTSSGHIPGHGSLGSVTGLRRGGVARDHAASRGDYELEPLGVGGRLGERMFAEAELEDAPAGVDHVRVGLLAGAP